MTDDAASAGASEIAADETAQVGEADDAVHVIPLVPDEMALARAQLDSGLAGLAEGTVRRRLAWLEADGTLVNDEADALRLLLAEALWRQARPMAARQVLDAIRASSPQRRLPIALVVEADGLVAAGEPDRAAGAMERVVDAIGVDAAWALQAGMPTRLRWPLPRALSEPPPRAERAPWGTAASDQEPEPEPADDARAAAARARLEEARVAYVAGNLGRGDAEMSIAVRLDPALAADGVAILEPTLGGQPAAERLLLYGDLLRAAGREIEAHQAYGRAAEHRR